MELRKGDLIEVLWLDILEDSVGDPDRAELAPRVSVGYFWSVTVSHGIQALVTTTTIDVGTTGQNGYCIYPLDAVSNIKIIRRGKGKVYREQPSFSWAQLEGVGESCTGLGDSGDAGERSGPGKVRGTRAKPVHREEVRESGGTEAEGLAHGGPGSGG